jgi:hypothetical protein
MTSGAACAQEELARRRKEMSPPELWKLFTQTVSGLHYMHEQGIVHRDLKPRHRGRAHAAPRRPAHGACPRQQYLRAGRAGQDR